MTDLGSNESIKVTIHPARTVEIYPAARALAELEMPCLRCGAWMLRSTRCGRCGAWCR